MISCKEKETIMAKNANLIHNEKNAVELQAEIYKTLTIQAEELSAFIYKTCYLELMPPDVNDLKKYIYLHSALIISPIILSICIIHHDDQLTFNQFTEIIDNELDNDNPSKDLDNFGYFIINEGE